MKELYNEFFRISKHEKISEKVMLTRIVTTVSIVILCLAAMSITAYAYFSCTVTSGVNMIKAANFEANVSITKTDPTSGSVPVSSSGRIQTANLDAGKYTIELSKGDSTADEGFCIITIGDEKFYSDQIGVDSDKGLTDAKVKFDLILSAPTRIEVLSHWGTSTYYGHKNADGTEVFVVNGNTLNLAVQSAGLDDEGEKSTVSSNDTKNGSSAQTEQETDPSSTQASDGATTPSTSATSENTDSADKRESTNTTDPTTEDSGTTQQSQSMETADTDSNKDTEAEGSETSPATDSAGTTDTAGGEENEQQN